MYPGQIRYFQVNKTIEVIETLNKRVIVELTGKERCFSSKENC